MVCKIGSGVIVCGPPAGVYKGQTRDCPECGTHHRFVVRWDGAWYGDTLYGACGDTWQDGWRAPRPFSRFWRREAVDRFEVMWSNAVPENLYDAYVYADVEMACSPDGKWEAWAEKRDAAHAAIAAHRIGATP